ncbi:MAG: radical SAM family heme chaperone HemW [Hydrogenobacter sp.]
MIEALYIHIPFCSYKCPYCDFVSFTQSFVSHGEYLKLLIKELELYKGANFSLRTIYLGGGTPSLLNPSLYEEFFKNLSSIVDIRKVEEITLECNPETYREDDFKRIAQIGINRVSIGVQSFKEKGLKALGRRHTVKDSLDCIMSAFKAQIDNINVDLIYAYPNQSMKDLEEELKFLEDLPVKHVSCYLLTPYEDTLFGELVAKGSLKLLGDDQIADMYSFLVNGLKELGFEHYEISNFAFSGYECKHNLSYWLGKEFLGIGVSAWSFIDNVRFGNTKNLFKYIEMLKRGEKPAIYREVLEGVELFKDRLFTRLRTSLGIPKEYTQLIPEDLLVFFESTDSGLRLKEEGMLVINEILLRIFESLRIKL